MKIKFVGGPLAVGKIEQREVEETDTFGTILNAIEQDLGISFATYDVYTTVIEDKKVKAQNLITLKDTPQSANVLAGKIVTFKKSKKEESKSRTGTPSNTRETRSVSPKAETSVEERITNVMKKYAPEKVKQVPGLLKKNAGNEMKLLKTLVKTYGPEPSNDLPVNSETKKKDELSVYNVKLTQLFKEHDPSEVSTVAALLARNKGKEEELIKQYEEKYKKSNTANKSISKENSKQTGSYKERVVALFNKYDPNKVKTVDQLLTKNEGKEQALIRILVKKYGPEPEVSELDKSTDEYFEAAGVPKFTVQPKKERENTIVPIDTKDELEATAEFKDMSPVTPKNKTDAPLLQNQTVLSKSEPVVKSYAKIIEYAMNAMQSNKQKSLQHRYLNNWKTTINELVVKKQVEHAMDSPNWEPMRKGLYILSKIHDPYIQPVDLKQEFIRRRSLKALSLDMTLTTFNLREKISVVNPNVLPFAPAYFIQNQDVTAVMKDAIQAIDTLFAETNELGTELDEFEKYQGISKNKYTDEIMQLKETILNSEKKIEEIKKENVSVYERLADSEKIIVDVSLKNKELEQELERLTESMPDEITFLIANKQNKINELTKKLATFRTKSHISLQRVMGEKEKLTNELDELRKKFAKQSIRNNFRKQTTTFNKFSSQQRTLESPFGKSILNYKTSDFLPDELSTISAMKQYHNLEESNCSLVKQYRGKCPNCSLELAAFGELKLTEMKPYEKAAFCFSCRKTFTSEELLLYLNA